MPLGKHSIIMKEQDCQQTIQDVLQRKSDIGIIHMNGRSIESQLEFFRQKKFQYGLLFESEPCLTFRTCHPLE